MTQIQAKQTNEKPNRQVFDDLKRIFFSRLERKTGWGKEELKREYIESVNEALFGEVERLEKRSHNLLEE
jgi:hypothetical protein